MEAYVQSQRGEGWAALTERYDDGGYTGANTDRPAFQRLLRDIESGKVDVVAVYKIDRLSRSLLDFMKIMESLEACGVGFASVTQAFDTRTSTGRMILRLLMTFAEYERDTISERTRDKVAAARRRGLWTGGRPVLGYDIVEKRLVVNETEAERVREIFRLYLDLGGLLAVVRELEQSGWTTKTWTNKKSRLVQGRLFHKGSLRHLLGNPLYAGRIRAGQELCNGAHEAIVDEKTWDSVQIRLGEHARFGGGGARNKWGALLKGLVRCGVCGSAMFQHFAARRSRRYFYYVCQNQLRRGASTCPGSRVSSGRLEKFVVEHVLSLGQDPALLSKAVDEPTLRRGVEVFGERWRAASREQRASLLRLLVSEVVFDSQADEVEIRFHPRGFEELQKTT